MKLNILGAEYDYIETENEFDERLENSFGGITKFYKKQIVINTNNDIKADIERIKIHEIIHAYLHESALSEYATDETLVDWIAFQLPKIQKTLEIIEKNKGTKNETN